MSVHEQVPDSINAFVVVGDFGFNDVDGPFAVEKDGTKWTIRVPTDGDVHTALLENNEGDGAVLLADADVVGGGLVDVVHEPEGEGELHVVVDQYARGGPGE